MKNYNFLLFYVVKISLKIYFCKSNTPLQSPNIHAGMAAWLVARGNKRYQKRWNHYNTHSIFFLVFRNCF